MYKALFACALLHQFPCEGHVYLHGMHWCSMSPCAGSRPIHVNWCTAAAQTELVLLIWHLHAWGCMSPNADCASLGAHNHLQADVKLEAVAVSGQPMCPNWHEGDCLHADALNTYEFCAGKHRLPTGVCVSMPMSTRPNTVTKNK